MDIESCAISMWGVVLVLEEVLTHINPSSCLLDCTLLDILPFHTKLPKDLGRFSVYLLKTPHSEEALLPFF